LQLKNMQIELTRLIFNQQQMSKMICETLHGRRRHSQEISTPVSLVEKSRVSLQEAYPPTNYKHMWTPTTSLLQSTTTSPSPDTKDKTDPHHGTLISSFFLGPCLLPRRQGFCV
jgi:hypothetical protein